LREIDRVRSNRFDLGHQVRRQSDLGNA
jgi:hypothetical protein